MVQVPALQSKAAGDHDRDDDDDDDDDDDEDEHLITARVYVDEILRALIQRPTQAVLSDVSVALYHVVTSEVAPLQPFYALNARVVLEMARAIARPSHAPLLTEDAEHLNKVRRALPSQPSPCPDLLRHLSPSLLPAWRLFLTAVTAACFRVR